MEKQEDKIPWGPIIIGNLIGIPIGQALAYFICKVLLGW